MRFSNGDEQPQDPPIIIQLESDSSDCSDVNLYYEGVLVGFFSSGKLYTISFKEEDARKAKLEQKGVKFVRRERGDYFRIDVEL